MSITVSEYIKNNELLELRYVPFNEKVQVIDIILEQLAEGDYVTLKRVSEQIIIESVTNLDLNQVDEETNLSGYDMLYYTKTFEIIYEIIQDEFDLFQELIELRIKEKERLKNYGER